MTTPYRGMVECAECGALNNGESPVERWLRNEPRLDSRDAGIVRYDGDLLLHRYRSTVENCTTRDVQAVMGVEFKAFGADLDTTQRDTLSLFSQVFRNQYPMVNGGRKRPLGNHVPLARAYSQMHQRDVALKLFGWHLLRFDSVDPARSTWIQWDSKPINLETLIALIRFDVDPDTLQPIDWLRRFKPWPCEVAPLPLFGE